MVQTGAGTGLEITVPATLIASISTTVIRCEVRKDGVLTDATSVVLSDAGATYGVRRLDTMAVVVAAGTAFTHDATGIYTYTFTDPAPGLTYQYSRSVVLDGVTYRATGTVAGGLADTTLLTTLDPYIVPRVSGAPLSLVHQAVRRVFRDFCRDTEIWRYVVNTLTVADQAYYAITPPTGTSLWKLLSVEVEETPVNCELMEPADEGITFEDAPSTSDDALEIVVIVLPDMATTSAPGWMLDRFGDGIVSGALGYLLGMADRPWFNAQAAVQELGRFREAIVAARIEKVQSRGPAAFLTIPPFA
jgi:hypothetical protein